MIFNLNPVHRHQPDLIIAGIMPTKMVPEFFYLALVTFVALYVITSGTEIAFKQSKAKLAFAGIGVGFINWGVVMSRFLRSYFPKILFISLIIPSFSYGEIYIIPDSKPGHVSAYVPVNDPSTGKPITDRKECVRILQEYEGTELGNAVHTLICLESFAEHGISGGTTHKPGAGAFVDECKEDLPAGCYVLCCTE